MRIKLSVYDAIEEAFHERFIEAMISTPGREIPYFGEQVTSTVIIVTKVEGGRVDDHGEGLVEPSDFNDLADGKKKVAILIQHQDGTTELDINGADFTIDAEVIR